MAQVLPGLRKKSALVKETAANFIINSSCKTFHGTVVAGYAGGNPPCEIVMMKRCFGKRYFGKDGAIWKFGCAGKVLGIHREILARGNALTGTG